MSPLDIIDKYSIFFILGVSSLSFGIVLLILKIMILNNNKLYEKFKESTVNDTSFWLLIASFISMVLKLIFTNNI